MAPIGRAKKPISSVIKDCRAMKELDSGEEHLWKDG